MDFASKSLTVSRTRDFGRGGTCGFTGDLRLGLADLAGPPADTALCGDDRPARMESLSSSLFGSEMGRGIRDLLDLLVLLLLASLPGVVGVVGELDTQELP